MNLALIAVMAAIGLASLLLFERERSGWQQVLPYVVVPCIGGAAASALGWAGGFLGLAEVTCAIGILMVLAHYPVLVLRRRPRGISVLGHFLRILAGIGGVTLLGMMTALVLLQVQGDS